MSEVAINNRAVGLVSIGNPVTLITSLDKFKTICPGYKIYICLNVIREHISDENFQKLTTNAYKIIADYEKYFNQIIVIESTSRGWITHGQCIDLLFHIIEEEEMVIYEEDAYLFSKSEFESMFAGLDNNDLVCVVAPQNPNNFTNLFSKLSIFVNAVNMPGKESIFFIRKSILSKYNWLGFDYMEWSPNVIYTRPEGTKLQFKENIQFDTFEFFSFNCWMNTNIKTITYNEQSYDYWISEGRQNVDEFYRNMSNPQNYIHYFNGALFQYLDYHHSENVKTYRDMMHTATHFGQFLYHTSTYIIHLCMLRTVKNKYIELLGKVEYDKQRRSLKNFIRLNFDYFGYFKIRHQYRLGRFIKFTNKFIKKYHTLDI